MADIITMKQSFISDIEFINKPEKPTGMKLQFKSRYNVRYSTQNICRAELETEVTAEGVKNFKVKYTTVGMFTFDASAEKEEIHTACYSELYPFARAFGYTLTTAAGIPPIYIPKIDFSNSEIFRIDTEDPTAK